MFGKKIIKEVKIVDEIKVKELEYTISQMRKDFDSEKRIHDNELVTEISKATKKKDDEITNFKIENSCLKKEVDILNKAFENMGFDVKDMKDILDQLVKGIVSKNEIKVIK